MISVGSWLLPGIHFSWRMGLVYLEVSWTRPLSPGSQGASLGFLQSDWMKCMVQWPCSHDSHHSLPAKSRPSSPLKA